MKYFSQLITRLDQSNKTNDKLAALQTFLSVASAANKVWAIALFTHRRPKRQVSTRQLRNGVSNSRRFLSGFSKSLTTQ
jgi:DNA ligase-1